jgi:hypothetical protein
MSGWAVCLHIPGHPPLSRNWRLRGVLWRRRMPQRGSLSERAGRSVSLLLRPHHVGGVSASLHSQVVRDKLRQVMQRPLGRLWVWWCPDLPGRGWRSIPLLAGMKRRLPVLHGTRISHERGEVKTSPRISAVRRGRASVTPLGVPGRRLHRRRRRSGPPRRQSRSSPEPAG